MSACPWCRESLPAVGAPAACPHCAKPLVDASGGRLRPLDLDFEALLGEADGAARTWLVRGAVFALVVALAGQVPVLGPVAAIVLVLAQLFWGRFLVCRRYVRHFGGVRRLVTRWIARLAVVLFVLPAYATAAVPVAGAVVCPLVFTGTNWALGAYARFHFHREHRREGVLFVEKVFLVLLALAFLAALVVIGLVAWLGVSLLPDGK